MYGDPLEPLYEARLNRNWKEYVDAAVALSHLLNNKVLANDEWRLCRTAISMGEWDEIPITTDIDALKINFARRRVDQNSAASHLCARAERFGKQGEVASAQLAYDALNQLMDPGSYLDGPDSPSL